MRRGFHRRQNERGFTIVELLIVVIVIAILAAITITAYNGITNQARESTLKTDLNGIAKQLGVAKVTDGSYPVGVDNFKKSENTILQYSANNATGSFCVSATNTALPGKSFNITNNGAIAPGLCSGDVATPATNGALMQAITTANCSSNRIMAVDARDNRTYWVQKMPGGKCWMLTNLAYAGGGTNTYGDTKTLQNGSADGAGTYTVAKYYVHANANPTTNPTQPTTSTDGGATNPQFGYLYNWCAAMGVQSTAACQNASTPTPDVIGSICPAGWRLPTGDTNGENRALNLAINNGATNTDAGLLTNAFFQRNGRWYNGAFDFSLYSYLWSSTMLSATSAYNWWYSPTLSSSWGGAVTKNAGLAIRCTLS